MHLWRGRHRRDIALFSLCPFRGHAVLKCSVTDNVHIDHLIKAMSVSHPHCEVFGRAWGTLRNVLPHQNVSFCMCFYQYGPLASYFISIIMSHNSLLSFIFMFSLSDFSPFRETLQANFCVILTWPHHSLGTFLFSGTSCPNAHLVLFLLQPRISYFSKSS